MCASWNHTLALHEDLGLPRNLLAGGWKQRGWKFNRENRGGDRIQWRDLPAWWQRVHTRRDLNLLALLTGFRAGDCMSLRWKDVAFEEGTIHRPNPKGGRGKAFTVPVSGFVLNMLRHRRVENRLLFDDDQGRAFPAGRKVKDGHDPHVQNMIEYRYVGEGRNGKKVRWLPAPHELRRTSATACTKAEDVDEHQRHFLMNHGPKQAHVGDRYVVPGLDDLREAVESVTRFLLDKAGVVREARRRGVG